jgi:hypothetical protein
VPKLAAAASVLVRLSRGVAVAVAALEQRVLGVAAGHDVGHQVEDLLARQLVQQALRQALHKSAVTGPVEAGQRLGRRRLDLARFVSRRRRKQGDELFRPNC